MRTFVAGVRGVSGLWTIYGISLIWVDKHSKTHKFSIPDFLSFRQSDIMYVLDATHISFLSEPNCLLRLKPFDSLFFKKIQRWTDQRFLFCSQNICITIPSLDSDVLTLAD